MNEAIGILDGIITKYSKTKVAQYARLLKADLSYQTKNYVHANDMYQQIINNQKPKIIMPFAYCGLGYTKENLSDYSQAISIYSEFLNKFGDHYLAPRIYESLARVYELNGSTEMAVQIYQKLATLYPDSTWAQKSQEKLNFFSRR